MQNRDKLCSRLATSLQMQAGKGGGKSGRIWEHRIGIRRLDYPEVIPSTPNQGPWEHQGPLGTAEGGLEVSGLWRGTKCCKKQGPPKQSADHGVSPLLHAGTGGAAWESQRACRKQGCRDGGRGDAGTRFNIPKSFCRLFCDPLPLLRQTQL